MEVVFLIFLVIMVIVYFIGACAEQDRQHDIEKRLRDLERNRPK